MDIDKMSVDEVKEWADASTEIIKLKEDISYMYGMLEGMILAKNYATTELDDEFYEKYEYHRKRYDELWDSYENLRQKMRQLEENDNA